MEHMVRGIENLDGKVFPIYELGNNLSGLISNTHGSSLCFDELNKKVKIENNYQCLKFIMHTSSDKMTFFTKFAFHFMCWVISNPC